MTRRSPLSLPVAIGTLLSPVVLLLIIAFALTGCSAVGNVLFSWGWLVP